MARTFGLFDFLLPPSCERGRARTRPYPPSSFLVELEAAGRPHLAGESVDHEAHHNTMHITCFKLGPVRSAPTRSLNYFAAFLSAGCVSRPRTITRRNAPSFSSPLFLCLSPTALRTQGSTTFDACAYLHPPIQGHRRQPSIRCLMGALGADRRAKLPERGGGGCQSMTPDQHLVPTCLSSTPCSKPSDEFQPSRALSVAEMKQARN